MGRTLKVLFLFSILGGLTALLVVLLHSGITRVSQVEINLVNKSKQRVLFERIEEDVKYKVKPYIGAHIWNVDLEEIMEMIDKDVRVEKIHIHRVLPNKISIGIDPYDPVLILYRTDGEFSPVAADGSLLPAIKATQSLDVPVLRGLEFFEDESLRQQAVQVAQALPIEGSLSRERVSEIRHEKKMGFVLFMVEEGHQIYLGPELETGKIKKLNRVLNYLSDRQIKWGVIDARFSKKIVVKPRNAS